MDAKLVRAFGHPDPAQGLRNARHLATLLDKGYPGAAASLREGLDEMFTRRRAVPTRHPEPAAAAETVGAAA